MLDMLKYSGGMYFQTETGGKTGTTNDYVDGWFMGISPNLVVGTWVGGEDRWIRFTSIEFGQGSYMAKPFFRKLIKRFEDEKMQGFGPGIKFDVPEGNIGIELDCDLYQAGGGNLGGMGQDSTLNNVPDWGDEFGDPTDTTEVDW